MIEKRIERDEKKRREFSVIEIIVLKGGNVCIRSIARRLQATSIRIFLFN